ncbi:MAG TPA: phosphoglycolate phosphatase [Castellaniella sp.]|uniref:phosphoglycolate phosphatase n=1 Tax=Castellaniella sp. TaxID=1955812 RepID=UPI002EE03390
MRFSAILFDLDGTLLNTIPDLAGAANAMRHDLGMAPVAQDILATYVGKGAEQLVIRALQHDGATADDALVARGLACYTQHYRRLSGTQSHPYPGVLEGLNLFRAAGCQMAVVTNKSTEFTGPLLRHHGLVDFFDVVVCGDTCTQKKPDPMPVLYACKQLDVPPDQALFIGDSINDALAAQAAGIPMLALPYGYNEGRPVQSLPADAIVGSLIEAAQWAGCATRPTEPA